MSKLAWRLNVILLYIQYGIYDSPIPGTFHRSAPSIISLEQQALTPPSSPKANRSFRLQDCLTITLTSEIGYGATGIVLHGTMRGGVSYKSEFLDIAVKFAFTHWQQDALRNEYEAYRELWLNGIRTGITTPLGLFDDAEGGPSILVMLFEGSPLIKKQELDIPNSHRYGGFFFNAKIYLHLRQKSSPFDSQVNPSCWHSSWRYSQAQCPCIRFRAYHH